MSTFEYYQRDSRGYPIYRDLTRNPNRKDNVTRRDPSREKSTRKEDINIFRLSKKINYSLLPRNKYGQYSIESSLPHGYEVFLILSNYTIMIKGSIQLRNHQRFVIDNTFWLSKNVDNSWSLSIKTPFKEYEFIFSTYSELDYALRVDDGKNPFLNEIFIRIEHKLIIIKTHGKYLYNAFFSDFIY
jgi:hypothetical protein